MVKLSNVVAAIAAELPDPVAGELAARKAIEACGLLVAADGEVYDPAAGLGRAPMRGYGFQPPAQQNERWYGSGRRRR